MICTSCGREFKARGRQQFCPACSPPREPLKSKICPRCGKEFMPRIKSQTYCSGECREKHKSAAHAVKRYTVHCTICGQEFQSGYQHARYCSLKCRDQAARQRCAASGPDRELTGLTVYLVHKYTVEGMTEQEIAGLLRRSVGSVREALGIPLKPYQQACLMEFLKGR